MASEADEIINELASLSERMGALISVAQELIEEGVTIDYEDDPIIDPNDQVQSEWDDPDHWMDDVLRVGYNDTVSPPQRTRGDVRFNDLVEVIRPVDIFNTPPLVHLSDTFRSTRLFSPPPLRRQYSQDLGYDSDTETVVEHWVDPVISPTDLFIDFTQEYHV